MTSLAIIVAEATGPRLATALTLAAAAAALGREVTMLFDGASVAALIGSDPDPLLTAALGLGVGITACQSGLAAAGLLAADLIAGVETGGMVGFLAHAGAAQIVLA